MFCEKRLNFGAKKDFYFSNMKQSVINFSIEIKANTLGTRTTQVIPSGFGLRPQDKVLLCYTVSDIDLLPIGLLMLQVSEALF